MVEGTKFRTWYTIALVSEGTKDLKLEGMERPYSVSGVRTMEDLNGMTIGQMIELSTCKDGREMFYKVCGTLLGLKPGKVDDAKATEVVAFTGWVLGQVRKINELFDKAKGKPDEKEIAAGIGSLKFGMFGIVDWFAQRMGMTDHEEVMRVPWMRVYKCMDMDTQVSEYNKRLAKVYQDNGHRK